MAIRLSAIALCCLVSLAHAQKFKVRIHVLGHDGKPMAESHASLTRNAVDSQVKIPAGRVHDNRYEFSLNTPGVYLVRLAGTHHRAVAGPLLVGEDSVMEVEARLGTLPKEMQAPDSIFVSGSFNNFSTETGLQKMTRQKNGSYTTLIPSESGTIIYRPYLFLNGDGIHVDATGHNKYKYDSNRYTHWASGNYHAVTSTSRKWAKVTFDPKLLITSDLQAAVTFGNPRSTAAKLFTAYLNADFRLMKFRLASYNFLETRQLGDFGDFIRFYDIYKDLSYLSTMASTTADKVAKDVYTVAAFHFIPNDSSKALKVLASLSPDSPVWKIGYSWTRPFIGALPDSEMAAGFAERIAAAQDDESVRAGYLLFAHDAYHKQEDEKNFVRLYNDFMKEFAAYPEWLEGIKNRNPLNRKIAIGKIIPDFSFVSMDDSSHVITPLKLKGKTYLIDLWATWCSPCVAEMKNLHQVYERFKNQGFTIVSISFDDTPDVVANFRQRKWNMPWYNAFAGRYGGEKRNHVFEQQGLPRAILVNPEGMIVAIDEQMKDGKLEKLLEVLLEKR